MSSFLIAAAVLSGCAAAFVFWRRGAPGRLSLSVTLAAGAVWSLTYGLELAATNLAGQELWGYAEYLGTTLLPPAWLVFALRYTGRGWVVRRWLVAALAIEPLVVVTLVVLPVTRSWVRLYPQGYQPRVPVVELGPAFWVHFLHTNALLVTATVLLVGSLVRISRLYWRQAAVLLGAVLAPCATNVLSSIQLGPFRDFDFSPLAFCLSSLIFLWESLGSG